MDLILQDVRAALRRLRRSPRFTLAATSLLAIGIGANVAVFSVVHALLVQPLPYADPDRLVRIWESHPELGIFRSPVSRGNFYDWRQRATSFEYIEAFGGPRDALVRFGANDPEIVRQASGTEHFMEMLGVRPLVMPDAEGLRLTYAFWQRRFGGDPQIIGTNYTFEGFSSHPLTIGGVMPKAFDFPAGADSWSIMSFGRERAARSVNVLARLKPGVSLEQACAEMDVLAAALAAEHPAENAGWRVDIAALHEAIVGDVRATVSLLYGAVCLVLLIAIINVAGLVPARLTQLERETAVRLALGASVPRLLCQQFIESVLLAGAAGVLGFGFAAATIHFMLALAPASIPRLQEIAVTRPVLAAAAGLAGVVSLMLWLLSSFGNRLTTAALTAGGREAGSQRSHTARSALMVGQIAFCVGLLVLSALVVRSFVALHQADNGFEPGGLLTVQIRHPIKKPREVVKHFAGVLFTAAGLYSLLSFLVTQRTRELAVRIAVGAGHSDLLRLVLGRGLRLTIVGVALGAGAALLATRFLRSIVPDIQPGDSWTFVAVAVLVLAVAAMASYLPARRATRIDPIVALRTE